MRAAPTVSKSGNIDAVIGGVSTIQITSFASALSQTDRMVLECQHADTNGTNGLGAMLGGDADGSAQTIQWQAEL